MGRQLRAAIVREFVKGSQPSLEQCDPQLTLSHSQHCAPADQVRHMISVTQKSGPGIFAKARRSKKNLVKR